MNKKKLLIIFFVGIIFILSIYLRLLYLGNAFWYDEACSWVSAKKSFPFGILENLLQVDLQHTPLYFFLLHFWIAIFGDSEIAIKSLSLIFGIATVPLTFIVSEKLTNYINSFLISLIVAVSPILVFFSTEARMYPIVVFLVLLSLNFLIDFEQKGTKKSLIKLIVANLLIPYTLVGGILYNFSVAICYGGYLLKKNIEKFKVYRKYLLIEFLGLIPYFLLIFYYAKMRILFVIKHEGSLALFQVVEVIRNFFSLNLVENLYWPSTSSYDINAVFAIFIFLPCCYFIYGLISGFKSYKGFLKVLYSCFFVTFFLFVLVSLLEINIFTVRYILYILPPLVILSVLGLYLKISKIHLVSFVTFFVVSSIIFNIQFASKENALKTQAFKSVQIEAQELNLGADDIVIMPFGADAPYYFRFFDTPRVFEFDFHKQVRNPFNDNFYNKEQQRDLINGKKALVVQNSIFSNTVISENFYNYFISNVNMQVPVGRYVLIAFFADDVNSITSITELRKSALELKVVNDNILTFLLKKVTYDMFVMLGYDFDFVKQFEKGNYTYYLFKKR